MLDPTRRPRPGFSTFCFLAVFVAALTIFSAGCKQLSQDIVVSNISGTTNRVLERHDAYVKADLSADAATALADSTAVHQAIDGKETVAVSALAPPLNRVMDRHDVYTTKDAQLTDLKRRANLRDTELLRQLLKEATTRPATR